MTKFNVCFTVPVFVTVTIDAPNEEDAIEEAAEYASLTQFAGNNGYDKLVGVTGSNVSVEPGDCGFNDEEVDVYPVED